MQFCVNALMILILIIGSKLIIDGASYDAGKGLIIYGDVTIGEFQSLMTYGFQSLMAVMMLSMVLVMIIISFEGIRCRLLFIRNV